MTIYDLVGHAAFGLIAISYMVKDVLWLRCLAILASLAGILYNYYVPATPLWLVIHWNLAFILVNVALTFQMLRQRALPDSALDSALASMLSDGDAEVAAA